MPNIIKIDLHIMQHLKAINIILIFKNWIQYTDNVIYIVFYLCSVYILCYIIFLLSFAFFCRSTRSISVIAFHELLVSTRFSLIILIAVTIPPHSPCSWIWKLVYTLLYIRARHTVYFQLPTSKERGYDMSITRCFTTLWITS